MRARAAAVLSIGALASGAATAACFDLLHSTSDILSACQIDAATPGCATAGAADAGPAGDVCARTRDEAQTTAQHACAWLGACESPMGKNAFGSCMFQALLAFDCDANPNHRVKGKARGLWACLSRVQSCEGVAACISPDAPLGGCHTGDYTACATPAAPDVRIE